MIAAEGSIAKASDPMPVPPAWGALEWGTALGLLTLLLTATLGEGGASAASLLAQHVIVLALLLVALARPRRAPGLTLASRPLEAFTVFLLLAVLGATIAPYAFASLLVVIELGMILAAGMLAARCGPGLLNLASPVLLLGGAALGADAAMQRFIQHDPRPAATFLNPNHLGAWLAAVLLLGLGFWKRERPRAVRWMCAAAAAPAVFGLVLCGSRGALIGLAAGVGSWGMLSWKRVDPKVRPTALAGLSVLLLVAAAGVAWRFRDPDPFRFQRLEIWQASLEAASANPWLGVGPREFSSVAANLNFPLEDGPLRYPRRFMAPHSDFLRAPCEFGVPATIALMLAIGLAARQIRSTRSRAGLPASVSGGTAALVSLLVQSAVDDLTTRPSLYLLGAVILGALLATPKTSAHREVSRVWRAAAAVILLGAYCVADIAPYLAWSISRGLPRGRLDSAQRSRLEAAIGWNPFDPDLWLRKGEDLVGDGADLTIEAYAAARECAERAARLEPSDAVYRRGLAVIEGLGCRALFRDEATRARTERRYMEAEDLSRHDPFLPLDAGLFLLSTADWTGARRAAERALRIEPEAIPPRLLLAEAALSRGGPDGIGLAERELAEAENRDRRWAAVPKETNYERHLLTLDPVWAKGLRERIRAARSSWP